MIVTYLLVTFCDLTLTLTLFNQTSVLMQYLYYTYARTLSEFKLFAARLIDSRAQNVKKLRFAI